MSLTDKFIEKTDADKEYKYKFLIYPNITYAQDLEKDSYIIVIVNVIKSLNELYGNIHFTVLLPYYTKVLNLPNVEQVIYELPTYPNTMRTHFDSEKFLKVLNWTETDFDVIYSHLPEHTAQIANVIHNSTNMSPEIVGYCHWYEIVENTAYSKNMFMANIAGTLEMKECGVNSVWLKNLILERCEKQFSSATIQKLDKILQPHYLGVDSIFTGKDETIHNSILFNHRPNEYTGFDWFIKVLDKIYEERTDFKLFTTLADIDRPYATKVDLQDRSEYLNFIRRMYIGIAAFERYSAWSIATTDAMSQGVPYLLPNKLCYPEMVGDGYNLIYEGREDFENKLRKLLDGDSMRRYAERHLDTFLPTMLWKDRVSKWFNGWKFLDELHTVKNSESYEKILKYIKTGNSVSKKDILEHMGWGVRISFSPYRNLLRQEPRIKFTKTRYIYE